MGRLHVERRGSSATLVEPWHEGTLADAIAGLGDRAVRVASIGVPAA